MDGIFSVGPDSFDSDNDDLDLTLYADAQELVEEVSSQVLAVIAQGLTENERFDLVLTGGTLGLQLSQTLIDHFNTVSHEYQGLHIWFSDERYVARKSSERNAAPFEELLTNTRIVVHQVPAADEATAEEALELYSKAVSGISFDLNILGLGPDGHVASIFPGRSELDMTSDLFLITDSPKPPSTRISFTMHRINSSKEVWMIASGASKADAVTAIIESDTSVPASYVRGAEHTRLIIDTEAFFTE